MSALLKEIQAAAVDANVPITNVLRKCAVLGAQLNNAELREWAFNELNGYTGDIVPEYRIVGAPAHAHLHAGGWEYKKAPLAGVILPEKLQERASVLTFREPIAGLQALIDGSPESDAIMMEWPGDWVLWVQAEGKFTPRARVVVHSIWQTASKASVAAILDTVRNKILEFCLRLAHDHPELAKREGDIEASPTVEQAAKQAFTQVFVMGNNNGNIAAGSGEVVQAVRGIAPGDLVGLLKALTDSGVPVAEVQSLEVALKEESAANGMGPRVAAWLGRAVVAVGSGAWTVTKGAGIATITKLLTGYFGGGG